MPERPSTDVARRAKLGDLDRCGRPARALAFALLVLLAPIGARAASSPSPITAGLPLIDRYRAALALLPPAGNMVFEYVESRSGPTRTLVEHHRVYRRVDGAERNETIEVNGADVVPAIVHYTTKPTWPYDVQAFAVDAPDYTVMPIGPEIVDGKHAFGYSVVRTTTGDFSVTGIYLDESRWLPLRETYSVTGGGCTGTGTIDFASFGTRWLPTQTNVNCTVTSSGAAFKETLTFSGYTFPPALPPDIFGEPS